MTEPTTKQLITKLKELDVTVDMRLVKMDQGHGEYEVWRCDLYRKKRQFDGYGTTPKTALWSAILEMLKAIL